VGLFGAEVEVAHLIDEEYVVDAELIEHVAGGAVGEGGVHLVEEVLGAHEAAAVPLHEGLVEERGGEARLADTRGTDEHEVLRSGGEVEAGELADGGGLDARLAIEGRGVEGPDFGEAGLPDPILEAPLALVLVRLAEDAREEVGVGERLPRGALQLP
jgi:hypothetical protein